MWCTKINSVFPISPGDLQTCRRKTSFSFSMTTIRMPNLCIHTQQNEEREPSTRKALFPELFDVSSKHFIQVPFNMIEWRILILFHLIDSPVSNRWKNHDISQQCERGRSQKKKIAELFPCVQAKFHPPGRTRTNICTHSPWVSNCFLNRKMCRSTRIKSDSSGHLS